MQTVQLLGGPAGRAAFLRCARAHLAPGGLLAAALADALEAFDDEHDAPPRPTSREVDGRRLRQPPVAVRDEGDAGGDPSASARPSRATAARTAETTSSTSTALDAVDARGRGPRPPA